MKKMLSMLATLFIMAVPAQAISYKTARSEALFLTDKMAYELRLSPAQRDAVYEINLDYLMSLDNYDDVYGNYWKYRDTDLSYVLSSTQYNMLRAAEYFYRPVYWKSGWKYTIYTRYTNRSHFYYGRPTVYVSYKGGHSWRKNGNRSWYKGRTFGNGRHHNTAVCPPNNHKPGHGHGKPSKPSYKDNGKHKGNHQNDKGNRHFRQ